MLGMDEPVHGRLAALVSKAFSQKALARWEDEIVGRVGNELIDRFVDRGKRRLGQGVQLSLSDPDHRRRCWACRRRTFRSSSAGRSRC